MTVRCVQGDARGVGAVASPPRQKDPPSPISHLDTPPTRSNPARRDSPSAPHRRALGGRYSLAAQVHTYGTNPTYAKGQWNRRLDVSSLHSGATTATIAVSDTFRRSHSVPPDYKHVKLNHPY